MEATEFWETLIPSLYVTITKCYSVVKKHISRRSGVEIVICTSHGEVLEFCDRKIVGICPISCFNPKSITIFTSYDFQCNIFYIIRSENGIIILSRKRGLKVVEQYEDVERVMVSDFSNVGFPQLGIWTKNSKESVTPDKILDLQEGSNTYSDECSISNILREKNQELSLKIEEYEHKLKVKKHLRLYNSEVTGHGNKLPFPSDSMLVLLGSQSGCRDLDPKEHLERGPSIRIAETWQKIHNGKWVVGISICNNGKSDVLDLRLILKCSSEDKLTYNTKLLMCSGEYESPSPCKRPRTSRGVAAWNEVIVLKPEGKAVLVGVLEAPKFVGNSVVSLTGAIMYKVDQEKDKVHHIPVSSFESQVEDFSRRMDSPFISEVTEADRLCVLMTSYCVTLSVVFISNSEISLQKILVDELKFVEFPSIGCLFHKGNSFLELSGIMLQAETTAHLKYSLAVCARDVQQLYLLAHCMYSMLSAPQMILRSLEVQEESQNNSISLNSQFLRQEFKLVLDQLKHRAREYHKSEVSMSWEEYSKFRSQLSELEMETDAAFARDV